jgi:hypothetical protein
MKSGMQEQGKLMDDNLSRLDPVDSVDFCGACRRTWEDVVATDSLESESTTSVSRLIVSKTQVLAQAVRALPCAFLGVLNLRFDLQFLR